MAAGAGGGTPHFSRGIGTQSAEVLEAEVAGLKFFPNASMSKDTRANIAMGIPTQLSTHPLLQTPLVATMHEVCTLSIDAKGITQDDFQSVRNNMSGLLAPTYSPVGAGTRAAVRASLDDFKSVLNGYRKLQAALVLCTSPRRAGGYNHDHSKWITARLVDAIRIRMFVAISFALGRVAGTTDSRLPQYMFWHMGPLEAFKEISANDDIVELDIQTEQRNLRALAAAASDQPPAAAAAAAAAEAVTADDEDEVTKFSIRKLAAKICARMTDVQRSPLTRIIESWNECERFMKAALADAYSSPSTPMGPTLLRCMAAIVFALYVESPQRCAYYPFHVAPKATAAADQTDDASAPTAKMDKKKTLKQRARHAELCDMASIMAVMRDALTRLKVVSSDLQKNNVDVITRSVGTIHRYSTDDLRAKISKVWTAERNGRWNSMGTDKSRSFQFELPPQFKLDQKQPLSKGEKHRTEPVLPVFFSFTATSAILDFITTTHTDRIGGVWLIKKRKEGNMELATQMCVEEGDTFVPCVLPMDATTAAHESTARDKAELHLCHILEAEWAVVCAWAHQNHYAPQPTSAARKLTKERKRLETPADELREAAAEAKQAVEFRRRINHTTFRVPVSHLNALFGADLKGDYMSRWHEEERNMGAWRLAECLAVRMPVSECAIQHPQDDLVMNTLTWRLRETIVNWLGMSSPQLPNNTYRAILRHNATVQERHAKHGLFMYGTHTASPESIAADVTSMQSRLRARTSSVVLSQDQKHNKKETNEDAKAMVPRGHIIRHLTTLRVLDAKGGVDVFNFSNNSRANTWAAYLTEWSSKHIGSARKCLSLVVGGKSRERLTLFKHLDLDTDLRFVRPPTTPVSVSNRASTWIAKHLTEVEPNKSWTLKLETVSETSGFRFDSKCERWHKTDDPPTPLERTLWNKGRVVISNHVSELFLSLLRLMVLVRDDALCHAILRKLCFKSTTPTLYTYDRKLTLSRLICVRTADSELLEFLRNKVSTLQLCDQFHSKAIMSMLVSSLRMISEQTWDTVERFGVEGALALAREKQVVLDKTVHDTFLTLLKLPNRAARATQFNTTFCSSLCQSLRKS